LSRRPLHWTPEVWNQINFCEGLLQPLVSVIIVNWNGLSHLPDCLDSLLKQTFRDFEIIVVDDGSLDETAESLTQFQGNIKTVRHSKNLGVSAARNSGIKASRSPLIAFLDSDDHWMPEKLEVQVRFFKENPDAVACHEKGGARDQAQEPEPSSDLLAQIRF